MLYKFIIKPIIIVPKDCLHLIRLDFLLDKLRNRKIEPNEVIELKEILKNEQRNTNAEVIMQLSLA
jgi:hypothetical protein